MKFIVRKFSSVSYKFVSVIDEEYNDGHSGPLSYYRTRCDHCLKFIKRELIRNNIIANCPHCKKGL